MKPIRLQKYLAEAGIASRRKAELLITAGRVSVNGVRVKTLGSTVNPETDTVEVGKKKVTPPTTKTVIALYKPLGYLSATSITREKGRPVTDLVKTKERLFVAGRLDQDSEGLLILTNDGDLALAISHPSYGHEKEYVVRTQEIVEQTKLRLFEKGVRVGRQRFRAVRAWRSGMYEFHIVLVTGHKHQIRQMANGARLTVTRLKRIRIGGLTLAGLQPGSWRKLQPAEIEALTEKLTRRRRAE